MIKSVNIGMKFIFNKILIFVIKKYDIKNAIIWIKFGGCNYKISYTKVD